MLLLEIRILKEVFHEALQEDPPGTLIVLQNASQSSTEPLVVGKPSLSVLKLLS